MDAQRTAQTTAVALQKLAAGYLALRRYSSMQQLFHVISTMCVSPYFIMTIDSNEDAQL